MKRLHFSSFRQRLNAAFLAVSLVPMLLCSGLLLQIFRLRMTSNAQQTAQQQLSASCEALDTLHSGFLQTAASLQHNPLVAQALFDAEAEDTAVYSQLFDATESVRSFARFDLYDISGRWRYSTQTAPEIRSLPTNWGLLYEAACAGTGVLVCSAAEDPADTDEPLLHAAMLLTDRYGAPVGYLTIGMLETQLRTLLGGTAGAQNELLLLDARWRPVYCTQPAQTQSLADALRGQLLSGEATYALTLARDCITDIQLRLKPRTVTITRQGIARIEFQYLVMEGGRPVPKVAYDYRTQYSADYKASEPVKFYYEEYRLDTSKIPPVGQKSAGMPTIPKGATKSTFLWRCDEKFSVSIRPADNPGFKFNYNDRSVESQTTKYYLPSDITMTR